MPTWVIPNVLARGRRPGYSAERGRSVPLTEVQLWVAQTKQAGIKSIICLLSTDQLPLYDQIPGGLISFYRTSGFTVEHIPVIDHQHPALSASDLQKVWTAYGKLAKPILIHCSAGVDRTGMAVDFIQKKLKEGLEV